MCIVMQRNSFFRLSLFIALNILAVPVFAQDQTAQNWWFGDTSTGIQFSQPGDTARLVSRTGSFAGFGSNGSAVASDPVTGGLLFYTDGTTIYDATHRSMPDGGGLTGNPNGGTPAVICRVPGQTNRYYVITNSGVVGTPGTLTSTIVDMTLKGNNIANPNLFAPALGNVDASAKSVPIPGLTNEAEPMVIIKHSNGVDYWLITQVANSNTFNVTLITATGFTTTPVTLNTSPGFVVTFTASQFAYNEPLGKLAIAAADINKNVLILNFDNAIGALTFDQYLNNSAATTTTQPVQYDLEWSDNTGAFLYVSQQGDATTNGSLLQYDLQATNASANIVAVNGMVRSYGLQLAPDSMIYHLYQTTAGGPIFLGRINDPDTIATEVNYQDSLFNAQFNAKQFPTFLVAQPVTIFPEFTFSGTCSNTPVTFFPTVDPGADSVKWTFGETPPTLSNAWSPIHTFTAGGTFIVRLTAYLNGDSAFVEHPVDITDFQLQLTLVADTIACSCELRFPKNDKDYSDNNADRYENGTGSVCPDFSLTATANGSPSNINWFGPPGNLGLNTLTLSPVDSAGFYYVTAEDAASGCIAYAGVNIQEYGVIDQRANIWHFGNNAGIDFNLYDSLDTSNPIPGPVVSTEGVATISDRNGQVIFSTNGEQVWDKNGVALLTGAMLGGSQNATQSSFIVPFPNDPTLYYIFTTQKVYPDPGVNEYEVRYAIFDLKIGDGNLVDLDNDPANGLTPSAVLFTKSTERLTGNTGWLIAHEYGNNNFRAYPITAQGIGAPVISSIGSDHSLQYAENAQGYMKQTGGYLVVALSSPGVSNVVEYFDFDNATGAVSNFRQVDLQQTFGQVYGVDIQGNRLLATTIGSPSMLHEFVLDTVTNEFERVGSIPPITSTGELGAIERGPDGQIYVAINGSGSLGTITLAGDFITPSTLNENGYPLSPTVPPSTTTPTSTLGLPNFIQSIAAPAQAPSIAFNSQCEDTVIDFTGSGTSIIDTLLWDFGDGQRMEGVNLTSVQHTYADPGTYTVLLSLKNRCAGPVGSIDTVITIYANPTALTGNLAICDGTEVMTATADPQPGQTYFWSTGDRTLTVIPPPGTALHNITVTSAEGCTARGNWLVTDIRPQIDLGPDQTLCQSSSRPQYDFSSEGDSFNWTQNNSAFSTAPAVTIPTNNVGTFEYKLTVNNSLTGCTNKDSVTFTINERPQYTTTGIDPTPPCGNNDGQIIIDITTTRNYTYFVSPAMASPGTTSGPATIPVGGLSAGVYNVNVTDQVSGCSNQRTVGLSDDQFDAFIARAQNCNDPVSDEMPVTITTVPGQADFTYTIYSGTTTNVIVSGDETFNPTPTVPNGSYVVEIKSPPTGAVCTAVSPVTNIRQDPDVPIDNVIPNVCTPPFTLEAVTSTPSPSFSWTPLSQIISGANTSTITIGSSNTPQTFKVEVTGQAGTCPHDTTVTVAVGSDPVANITQSGACTDFVRLTATPSGDYDYLWTNLDDSSIPPFFAGPQIAVGPSDNGDTYRVEVINQFTGCRGNTFDLQVAVLGELDVNLAVPLQICQGTPYSLSATTSTPQPSATYVWELDNQVLTGETGTTLRITDNREGVFKVVATTTSGTESCQDEEEVTIIVAPTTPGLLPESGILCPGSTIELDAGPGFISYRWFDPNNDPVPDNTDTVSQTILADLIGTYNVNLLNIYRCASSDKITLIEQCDPSITGPNAFRPDGFNKEFGLFPQYIDETSFEIYIFNRWGEMVFYATNPKFRWNGGYKNDSSQPLPNGTYTYLVKYKAQYRTEQLGTLEYRGGVVLLR
jgi:large repetitive protein